FICAAIFDMYRRRQVKLVDRLPDFGDGRAEIGAFEIGGDDDVPLQVFAADLVLRGELFDIGQGAQGSGVARGTIEDGIANGVKRKARLIAKAHPNRILPALGDEWSGNMNTVE